MDPHSVSRVSEDRLLVTNLNTQWGDCSEATEVFLDAERGEATILKSWTADNCPVVYYLGNSERLDSGNTLVSWSSAGQLDELDPEGNAVLRATLPTGGYFGYVQPVSSLY